VFNLSSARDKTVERALQRVCRKAPATKHYFHGVGGCPAPGVRVHLSFPHFRN
jgi:hypothetical protein